MLRSWFSRRALPALGALLIFALLSGQAVAAPLHGSVVDALSGEPVEGAKVRLAATLAETQSDEAGAYVLEAPEGALHVLEVDAEGYHQSLLTRQDFGLPGIARLMPLAPFPSQIHAVGSEPVFGVPWRREEAASMPGRELRLPLVSGPIHAVAPAAMPETIRVGRRFASSCSGNPVQRIDEMPFEDYVSGVLPAEIGVFKSVPGGPESSRSVFEAFAVLARSYALWYSLYRGADAEWHIDDTACEQRYEDDRDAWITEVVMSTEGQVLVKAADPTIIDKYEYAASCGRYGSRPAYQTELVPDDTARGCTTGGWCGHDTCAAHEANPNVSPPDNRCLVRGVCQWGSLERSLAGQTKEAILGHYQKNLLLLDLGGDPVGNLVGLVREDDIQTGAAVEGARVWLDTGESTSTGAGGMYRFDGLAHGTYEITAEATGYLSASLEKVIDGPGDHWASIALTAEPQEPQEPQEPEEPEEPIEEDPPVDEEPGGGGDGLPRPSVISGGCACTTSDRGDDAPVQLALLMALMAATSLARRRGTN